jgi:3-oxoacyl-[acyl-carrier-protein] synthase III
LYHARISGIGSYVPPKLLTNADLEKMVDTSDEWILTRTGITQRHIADRDVATSDLSVEACKLAMENAGVTPDEIDAIIMCTVTPDYLFPATACIVQDRLGCKNAWGFDLAAACSGFVYGLTVAGQLVHSGSHKKVLVIGADTMSRIIDYTDRTTCVLFGDGAGAFVVEPDPEKRGDFMGFKQYVDGSGAVALKMPAGGSKMPPSAETIANRQHYVKQDGAKVFRYAVQNMGDAAEAVLKAAGVSGKDVKLLIPHQANMRIITAVGERIGMTDEQMVINIQKFGNTTAATIPLATQDAVNDGRLKKGDLVLFASVGAGFTVGASLWRWSF